MKFDVVVPVFLCDSKILDMTVSSIKSLIDNTKNEFRLILVDDGSPKEFVKRFQTFLAETGVDYFLVTFPRSGYTKVVNEGIRKIDKQYAVLSNNDIWYSKDWDAMLIEALQVDPQIGCIVPVVNTQSVQNADVCHRRYGTSGWVKVNHMVAFCCAMFRSDVFKKVGLLNEKFVNGLGSDDEFCLRLKKNGYDVAIRLDCEIKHGRRTTFKLVYGDKIKEEENKALELFRKIEKEQRFS